MNTSELAPLVQIDTKNADPEDRNEYLTPSKIKREVFDPFCDQTDNEGSKINDLRVVNEDGRFPCKHCYKTYKYKNHVKRHEQKSCTGKFFIMSTEFDKNISD